VEAVLIHHLPGGKVPPEIASNPKLIIFENYADAARARHSRGVISDQQLDYVLKNPQVG
jgi:hypothetical protein